MGKPAYEQAVRESRFFFRDECLPPCSGSLEQPKPLRILQPVLIVEGGEGRKHGLLSQQVTELAMTLLPQAEFAMIEGVNHLMPLQDRHWGEGLPTKCSVNRPVAETVLESTRHRSSWLEFSHSVTNFARGAAMSLPRGHWPNQ